MKLIDRIEYLIYRIVRSDAGNSFNMCSNCKKRRTNWVGVTYKKDLLIGYETGSKSWLAFTDYNFYAKTFAMNGYLTNIYTLNEKLWNKIKPLCRICITSLLKDYIEQDEVR